ncbi:hypothetical protein Clacol_009911 [Clathrus columnatus]|uniref:DUF6533 domain-containing protein n=1 Tax=Clathrus columnatus TaxID=1419009 RepID=A0AAV5AQ56_9AGAM|nr:hypothetical protein Clacol_009911 [Clathrus columnatus]
MDETQLQQAQAAELLAGVATIVQRQRIAIIVSTTILVFDHSMFPTALSHITDLLMRKFSQVSTFGDEITYIWQSQQSMLNFVTIFFLAVRYLTPFGLIFSSFCNRIGHRADAPDWVISLTRLCLVGRSFESLSSIYYVGLLIVDTTIFIMTLYKVRLIMRNRVKHLSGRELVIRLLRDGAMYYVVVCLTHFVNFLLTLLGDDSYRTLGASFSQVFSTILVSRLFLRLRKTAYIEQRRTVSHPNTNAPATHSTSLSGIFTSQMVQFFQEGYTEGQSEFQNAQPARRSVRVGYKDDVESSHEDGEFEPQLPDDIQLRPLSTISNPIPLERSILRNEGDHVIKTGDKLLGRQMV